MENKEETAYLLCNCIFWLFYAFTVYNYSIFLKY